VDAGKVANILASPCSVYEPGLEAIIAEAVANQTLTAGTDLPAAIRTGRHRPPVCGYAFECSSNPGV
jgi:UDP-glucose 6-dehydrogenase